MKLIVGLGNPDQKLEKTRHNTGFRIVDEFVKKNYFQNFRFSKKFNSEISKGTSNNQEIMLAKPRTFMNNSGRAVKSLIAYYKLKSKNLFVIHDDMDLPLGKIKISIGRGSAGHKGVQSIVDELRTKKFVRFRIGIRPQGTKNRKQKTDRFVLQKFNKNEEEILKEVFKKTCKAIEIAIRESLEKAMNEFNK